MKLTCLSSTSSSLVDEQRGRFRAIVEHFALTEGGAYTVVGIQLLENVLHVLTKDDNGMACLAPAALFAPQVGEIPAGWYFALEDGLQFSGPEMWIHPRGAVWGYPEMVTDPKHLASLQELDRQAVRIFERRFVEYE